MTRKDYKLLAEALGAVTREARASKVSGATAMAVLVGHLATRLREENSNFNKDKFFEAIEKEAQKKGALL